MNLDLATQSTLASRYQLKEKLGIGSLGITWLAHDAVRDQSVVIKLVQEEIIRANGGFTALAEILRITCTFRHPSVMRVFDFAQVNADAYISMEFFRGQSLSALMNRARSEPNRPFKLEQITQIITTIADILQDGDSVGIPHGGIQPENIYLHTNDEIRVSEYGLNNAIHMSMLRTSAALHNTGHYLAPELYEEGATLSFQSDQYALGVLWRELLESLPDANHSPAIKTQLELAQRLSAADPSQRFNNIRSLQTALDSCRLPTGGPAYKKIPSRTIEKRPTVYLAALALILALIWGLRSTTDSPPDDIAILTDRSTLKQLVRTTESKRMELLSRAFAHSELRAGVQKHFSALATLETIESFYERQNQESETAEANTTQQQVQRIQAQLAEGTRFLDAYEESLKWQAELTDQADDTLPQLSEWLSSLETASHQAVEHFEVGLIGTGITRLESELGSLRNTLQENRDQALALAQTARSQWTRALSQRNTPYAEPNEDLSGPLESLSEFSSPASPIQHIKLARHITQRYAQWTREWETLPKKNASHFENSLGMLFQTIGPLKVSIWETRVIDFFHFIKESGFDENRFWREEAIRGGPTHPVTSMSRYGATQFCEWLTRREQAMGVLTTRQSYSLPTDLEWSHIAGLSDEKGSTPLERHARRPNHLPWSAPPKDYANQGNYFTPSSASEENNYHWHLDRYYRTAPAGQFPPNAQGIYDLGGNAMEWVSTPHRREGADIIRFPTLRGAGWRTINPEQMQTGFRINPPSALIESGFRCVIREDKSISP